ncbi:hypothetical protein BDW72DRAFT_184048 [Aspergillus terricola var. indicus]
MHHGHKRNSVQRSYARCRGSDDGPVFTLMAIAVMILGLGRVCSRIISSYPTSQRLPVA